MFKNLSMTILRRLRKRFEKLYGGKSADRCIERLIMMVGRYGVGVDIDQSNHQWNQSNNILITYGDMIKKENEPPLFTLKHFLDERLKGAIHAVHILPFFPYSSDDGFSIIDYRSINPDLGTWEDIESIAENFHLMFDLVLNHVSKQSSWLKDYVYGIAPARYYFIEVGPSANFRSVVRPRNLPLYTPIMTRDGQRYLWTTFSDDQIDLNFANPDVLFEFIDILFFYISKGATAIRLDAIAYLWKKLGTSCIHLSQTHEVVKIFRDILNMIDTRIILITETNVPHKENIKYFGSGDEAHMIYQFSLPPLLLHAFYSEDTTYLTEWASALPELRLGCTYLNFTASHDGIGIRPLEGLVPDEEFDKVLIEVQHRGGYISTKTNKDGSESPYELNITYFDALSTPGHPQSPEHMKRFLCSQTVVLGLKGIPGIYFHSLTATKNDYALVEQTQRLRSINRKKWKEEDLNSLLDHSASQTAQVFNEYVRLLEIRSQHPAFHPDGKQTVYNLSDKVFAFLRMAPDGGETIVCISNFCSEHLNLSVQDRIPCLSMSQIWKELIADEIYEGSKSEIYLEPYQTVWLCV